MKRLCKKAANGWAAFAVIGVAVCATIASSPSLALTPTQRMELDGCIVDAANEYALPRELIDVVLDLEGGHVGTSSLNTNGTRDLGPMQVNTWWLEPRRGRTTLASFGLTAETLQWDGCVNIYAGAWILARLSADFPSWVDVLARYHSPTAKHQLRYLKLALAALQRRRVAGGDAVSDVTAAE